MTEKRFTINTLNGSIDLRDNNEVMTYKQVVDLLNEQHEELQKRKKIIKQITKDYNELKQINTLCNERYRELADENEQFKKREEQLLSEIEDFQQLLTKKDNVCYKQVIELIDVQIKNGEKAIEWAKNVNVDYGTMGFHIEMLKKLKKELKE